MEFIIIVLNKELIEFDIFKVKVIKDVIKVYKTDNKKQEVFKKEVVGTIQNYKAVIKAFLPIKRENELENIKKEMKNILLCEMMKRIERLKVLQ